jgi:tetratricopeptide (TPR) repeat protein
MKTKSCENEANAFSYFTIARKLLKLKIMENNICSYEAKTLKYFTSQLSNNELAEIEAHIAECDECCKILATLARMTNKEESIIEESFLYNNLAAEEKKIRELVKNTLEDSNSPENTKEIHKPTNVVSLTNHQKSLNENSISKPFNWKISQLAIAASLVIFFLLGAFAVLNSQNSTFNDETLAKSILVIKEINQMGRPNDLRIAEFDYAPSLESRGSTEEQKSKLITTIEILTTEVEKNPTPINRQILAQALILSDDHQKAIEQLSLVLAAKPADLAILNDLAVAQAAIKNYQQALVYINEALKVNPNYLPAIFNRALIYQQLKQYNDARSDWENYLKLDTDSSWAIEAKKNLQQIP